MEGKVFLCLLIIVSGIGGCTKDCEEPKEPSIIIHPHFKNQDSVHVWADFESPYDLEEVELVISDIDSSLHFSRLSALAISLRPINEEIFTNGTSFSGRITLKDKWLDTVITSMTFESFLEGGDDSEPCINPVIKSAIFRQNGEVVFDGVLESPPSKIYLSN